MSVARAGHLPTFDIVLSRDDQDFDGDQISRNVGGAPIGSPADQTQKTDSIGVQVTVPIYSGGATSSRVRQRNRCELTGRPRAVYRKFKMARNKLRELASKGQIPGMVKSSW